MTLVKVDGIGEVDVPDDSNLYVTIFEPDGRSAVIINGGMMIWPAVSQGIATGKNLIAMMAQQNPKAGKFVLGPVLAKLPTVTHNGNVVEAKLTPMQEIQALAKVLKSDHGFAVVPGQEANAPTPCEVAIMLLAGYKKFLTESEARASAAAAAMTNDSFVVEPGSQGDFVG